MTDADQERLKNIQMAAERARAEAEERRKAQDAKAVRPPREINGRDGPDPVRYGDWEVGGKATDF